VSERSVAEIIGWSDGHRMAPSGVCAFCGAPQDDAIRTWCPHGIGSPTVDDLLTWLREQGAKVYGCTPGEYDDLPITDSPVRIGTYWTERVNGVGVDRVHAAQATTLLAALEAAVRAVAGES
jgi:hypothetical protein